MGVHTGDSITVAPAMTLTDREYQHLRDLAIGIIRAVGVDTGGCNIQYAVNPADGRVVVIEMNPRVSRSSALASQGHRLPDRQDRRQGRDRLHPRRDPQRHHHPTRRAEHAGLLRADARLRRGQGAAVRVREVPGRRPDADHPHEVGRRGDGDRPQLHRGAAEGAALAGEQGRAVRLAPASGSSSTRPPCSSEAGCPHDGRLKDGDGRDPGRRHGRRGLRGHQDRPVVRRPADPDQRGRRRGDRGHRADARAAPAGQAARLLRRPDRQDPRDERPTSSAASGTRSASGRSTRPSTPARPSSPRPRRTTTRPTTRRPRCARASKPAVIILGCGPNRIGQGIEFDYSCVHASLALGSPRAGRLRDDHGQLQPRDGLHRLRHLRPALLRAADARGRARDRARRAAGRPDRRRDLPARRPDAARARAGARRRRRADRRHHARRRSTWPRSAAPSDGCSPRRACRRPSTAWRRRTTRRAAIAAEIGYPVLVRPSYVLGGRGMEIVYDDAALEGYIARATAISPEHPVLVDRFIDDAVEIDVDAHLRRRGALPRRRDGAHRGGRHPLRRLLLRAAADHPRRRGRSSGSARPPRRSPAGWACSG